MKRIRYAGLVLALSTVLLGCQEKDDSVVATVNGQPVTQKSFDAYLKFKRVPQQNAQWVDREFDSYLEREALASQIESQNLLSAEQIEVELNEFRKQMLISRYFEQYLREQVTDEAVRNFYAANPDQFQTQKVHVAHILLRTRPGMSDAEREAILSRAREVHSRIRAQEDFAELASTYSEDQLSAKKGGDLGWLQEGAIAPLFSTTVFNMKTGDVSEPFATPFGFHIVKVVEGPQMVKQPFESVSGDIRYRLRQEARQAEIDRLKKKAQIEKKKVSVAKDENHADG